MDIKNGWKTTEFWVSIGTALLGLGVLFGFASIDESQKVLGGLNQIVGGIMTVVPIVGYAISRGKAKSNVDYSSVLSFLSSFVEQPTDKANLDPQQDTK